MLPSSVPCTYNKYLPSSLQDQFLQFYSQGITFVLQNTRVLNCTGRCTSKKILIKCLHKVCAIV